MGAPSGVNKMYLQAGGISSCGALGLAGAQRNTATVARRVGIAQAQVVCLYPVLLYVDEVAHKVFFNSYNIMHDNYLP